MFRTSTPPGKTKGRSRDTSPPRGADDAGRRPGGPRFRSFRPTPWACAWLFSAGLLVACAVDAAAPPATDTIVNARAAYAKRDRTTLAALRKSTAAAAHPLAMWVDYWDISLRLRQAKQSDLEAFYARWPGTAVEQRLRKDWIIERGKHGDMEALRTELPRLRSPDAPDDERDSGAEPDSARPGDRDLDRAPDPPNDAEPEPDPDQPPGADRSHGRDSARDREVACYALLQRHEAGQDVAAAARERWFAQREADHGCALLAATLYHAGRLSRDDVWARARLAAEQGRRFVAQHAIGLLASLKMDSVHQAFLQPQRYLSRRIAKPTPDEAELTALAAMRLAARNAPAAAAALADPRGTPLPPQAKAAAWAVLAKSAAIGQRPQAFDWYQRAAAAAAPARVQATPDTLAWQVRTALRAQGQAGRWQMIVDAVDAMSPAQRAEPTWAYWKARAVQALAAPGVSGFMERRAARLLFESIATQLGYHGGLAARELGREPQLPKPAPALSDADRAAAQRQPGLQRGLALLELRLREEGLAEWSHAVQGMSDRELRAAAQVACDAQVWNLCMSTSERTAGEIDMAQRFPTPYREQIDAAAREADIDPARIYAVIRQESRFSIAARSVAGAAGLMQLMPQTARWVAGRYRIPYDRGRILDPAINVRIGSRYLKLVLNDFGGSYAHAAAAYNAGPSRPRRWNKAGIEDLDAWTETIPIDETRDYVKHVLANAVSYRAILGPSADQANRRAQASPESAAQRGGAAQAPAALAEPALGELLTDAGNEQTR
jgi:soluble lytic murein transglycosylase